MNLKAKMAEARELVRDLLGPRYLTETAPYRDLIEKMQHDRPPTEAALDIVEVACTLGESNSLIGSLGVSMVLAACLDLIEEKQGTVCQA